MAGLKERLGIGQKDPEWEAKKKAALKKAGSIPENVVNFLQTGPKEGDYPYFGKDPGAVGSVASNKKTTPTVVKPDDRKKVTQRPWHGVTGSSEPEPMKTRRPTNTNMLLDAASQNTSIRPLDAQATVPKSLIHQKARENLQRTNGGIEVTRGLNDNSDPFGPAPINRNVLQGFGYGDDPETVRFNRFLHAHSMAETPDEKTALAGAFFNTKGLDEEQLENKGSALAERIRAKSNENIARMQGRSGVEEAGISAKTGTPVKPYTGTLTSEDETGIRSQIPYNEFTGQPAPGYGASQGAVNLDPNFKKFFDIKKFKSGPELKDYLNKYPVSTREKIKKYLQSAEYLSKRK